MIGVTQDVWGMILGVVEKEVEVWLCMEYHSIPRETSREGLEANLCKQEVVAKNLALLQEWILGQEVVVAKVLALIQECCEKTTARLCQVSQTVHHHYS